MEWLEEIQTKPSLADLKPSLSDFTEAEVREMEILFEEVGEESLSQEFCQELAISFSYSSSRAGKPAIQWEQVQSWFQNKQKEPHNKPKEAPAQFMSSSIVPYESVADVIMSSNAPESSQKCDMAKDLTDLAFEARSFKDNAWYDVASFLTYRVLCTGELEARVRFAGFRNEQDEWVNVKKAVRERSIPLEPTECHKVNVGDLVLCFQERETHAVYCDAHIVEIERRLHDIRGCRCIFVVRYDHDNAEEKVLLERLCTRPN